MTADELQSQTISFMRFPLIVGVVFIHFYMFNQTLFENPLGIDMTTIPLWVKSIVCCCSRVLPEIAVPLFFIIAGYFFFYHSEEGFTKTTYRQKICKRVKTLLIPYLIWNTVYTCIHIVEALVTDKALNLSIKSIALTFFDGYKANIISGVYFSHSPIDPPLWFVRDLMIIILFTPILYWLIKKLKGWFTIPFIVVWGIMLGHHDFIASETYWGLFFTIGAYFSINQKSIINVFRKLKLCIFIYPLLIPIDMYLRDGMFFPDSILLRTELFRLTLHTIIFCVGIIVFVNIASYLVETGKVRIHPLLTNSVFFILAIHWVIINPIVVKIVYNLLGCCNNPLNLIVLYFLTIMVTILFCLGIYWGLKRFCPRFCAVLTGGR